MDKNLKMNYIGIVAIILLILAFIITSEAAILFGVLLVLFLLSDYNDSVKKEKNFKETILPKIKEAQDHKYYLKEMAQKDLIQGDISGSFLLASGSILGKIENRMFLAVTYFDDEKNVHRITKFNLEEVEIVTIGKDEKPHFKYSEGEYHIVYGYTIEDYVKKIKESIPRIYLPDGWTILEK